MIPFSVDDYVVTSSGNKKELMVIVQKNKNAVYGVREKQRSDDHIEHVEIDPKTIVANLGTNPILGSVYGNSTEVFRGRKELEEWGTVKFFRSLDKKELKHLKRSLLKCSAKIKKLGIDLHPFVTEIREARGKWDGMYHFRPKKKDGVSLDLLQFKPKTFEDAEPLIYHELGHAIWYRRIDSKLQARWILAYQRAITLEKVKPAKIQKILDDFFESNALCKEFAHGLEDEENKIFQACLDYANEKHRLSAKHLNVLIYNEKPINQYFTIEDIKLQDIELVLTEYAKESAEEFFAEAVSLHLSGKILPKSLRTLMELTLTKAAHYVEQEDEND